MTTYDKRTLEEVIRKQAELERELQQLRDSTNKSQRRAHERISVLEKRMDDINAMLMELTKSTARNGEKIDGFDRKFDGFDRKQDKFLSSQMQLSKWFVIIILSILVVLGGLVGIKLVLPAVTL